MEREGEGPLATDMKNLIGGLGQKSILMSEAANCPCETYFPGSLMRVRCVG